MEGDDAVVDQPTSIIRRGSATIIEFTSRAQELNTISRRLSNGSLVSDCDLKRFEQELSRNFHQLY